MRVLSDDDVRRSITVEEAIEVNERAFIALQQQRARVPPRIGIPFEAEHGVTLFKPAYVQGSGIGNDDPANANDGSCNADGGGGESPAAPATTNSTNDSLGLKVVSVRPNNASKGLPTVPATIMTFDAATGAATSVMNATYLTALRTAAGSAVATRSVVAHSSSAGTTGGLADRRSPTTSGGGAKDEAGARPPSSLLVIGAGLQGELHIRTIRAVCPGE